MCGIVGYVGNDNPLGPVIEGLKRLEYRGYDSAGVAIANGKTLKIVRSVGRVSELEKSPLKVFSN
jgi:glucosamine--fructose-6-phosphate aminotransferase (isomerizing)